MRQKGFANPLLLLFLLVLAVVVILFVLASRGVIQNPIPESLRPFQKLDVKPQTQYENPFDKNTQYANPFNQYKNPFDNLK